MNTNTLWLSIVLAACSSLQGAEFRNLDFESAAVPVLPPDQSGGFVPVAQAFPGWSGFVGATPVTEVLHNTVTFGSAALSIFGPNTDAPIIEGSFSAYLIPGWDERVQSLVGVGLAQNGFIPAEANSLWFKAKTDFPELQQLSLTVDGQDISYLPAQIDPNYVYYAGDISAFAGKDVELRFTTPALARPFWLDDISFSAIPIPEPSSWALLTGGLLCLAAFIRKRVWR